MKKRTLLTVILIGLLSSIQDVKANDSDKIPFYIYNAANKFHLDIALLYSICTVESRCRVNAVNHNDGTKAEKEAGIVKKAYGLFQLQLDTAKSLGFKDTAEIQVSVKRHGKIIKVKKTVSTVKDLLNPEINTWFAAKYLQKLYKKYNNTNKVISAYNAGHYTRANDDYVLKVLKNYSRYKIDKRF